MLWYWTIFVAFIVVSAVLKATGIIDLPGLARGPGWVVLGLILLGPGWMCLVRKTYTHKRTGL